MVLDEVHANAQGGNWRDVYRAPSSDMPSSFDEFDMTAATNANNANSQQNNNNMERV
eukprot:CAMPEP_0197824070 /NCGR_PEP_ID=MMETSP1437-20131217/1381_1 /TAXON_ID=49252 ORGANISM="Eucampia antarctica, Strain CCMP1452" /NCGR_SAMPLE_ID=MMETSP1437 /ASSEMBLY_ACC=CAM_ASM_001096 /LENGTH=56 /DNA_ID=CAMNT_0043423557 /DNA_START=139 /DNA_END=309 /DNA_ORIENTATION=+